MSLEFFNRLQKELSITGNAVYESVLAVAERVNRKVHILRLHGQAARLLTQIETVQGELGRQIAALLPDSSSTRQPAPSVDRESLERQMNHVTDRVHRLKQRLVQIDANIRELKLDAIHEDLLTLQRELSLRSSSIERVVVAGTCQAVGKSLAELSLPSSIRVVTVFRGPFLLAPSDGFTFRPDDIAVLLGPNADLEQVDPWFTPSRKSKSA